jgi:2-keto-4-pentenoate hydratase/2-oxohepta-3-ene-1,7-dioic acid hydratase in catechol pathway
VRRPKLQGARSRNENAYPRHTDVSETFLRSFYIVLIMHSVFLKASTCIASASEPIILPSNVDYDEADYEVELAVVIGKQCKNVSVSEAADYILGYSVANDVTARKHQDKTSQWSYAKGMVCHNQS